MKKVTVSLSGGEVFLHKDFYRIIQYCKEKNVTVRMIITNGTLFDEAHTPDIAHAQTIVFSIDGPEKVHDVIRGVAGSHKKTMHAIKCIDEFKKKNGLAYPAVGINTVIVKDTIEHIGELVDHLLDFKAHVSGIRLQYLTYITEETFNQHVETLKRQYPDMHYFYWEKFVMHDTGIHAGKLLALFEAVKKKTARAMVPLHISWNFTEHQINTWYTTSLPVLHTCGFLRAFLVLPNGDVPLCDFIRYPIGNIKHGTLKDIWKNMQRKKFKRLISQKLLPGCERCCHLQ